MLFRSRLNGIAEVAPNDVWAVGAALPGTQYASTSADSLGGLHTLIEHWDGHRWSIVPSPDGSSKYNELFNVAGASANDVWAVGSFGGTLVEHWDGSQWQVLHLPVSFHSEFLTRVIALAHNDIWVAGSALTSSQSQVLLLAHWDGQQWSMIPGLEQDQDMFPISLQATSPHDIWLTGQRSAVTNTRNGSFTPAGPLVVEHWNGVSLQQEALPSPLQRITSNSSSIMSQQTNSASVRALNDIWIAGGPGTADIPMLLDHWDGHAWKTAALPRTINGQFSVLAVVRSKVWAAGTRYDADQATVVQLVETMC